VVKWTWLFALMLCAVAFLSVACTGGSNQQIPTKTPTSSPTATVQPAVVTFNEAERVKITNLANNISQEAKQEFDEKYQAWQTTWYTPELLVQSNPRAFTQSQEYGEFLSFCQEQGKVVWPLLFKKLEGDSLGLINEVIGDLTLAEYGQILDRTRQESLELYTEEGIFIDPFLMYLKELLALL